MLPSMWRIELLHPMTVHFPIALLIVGAIFYLLSTLKIFNFENLRKFSFILIAIGTVTAWIANYTGGLAEEVVGSTLCDPQVRLDHEDYAYYATYLFTAFLIFYFLGERISLGLNKLFVMINVILLITGTALLIYVGHLGANLTYQQGAAVYHPGPECKGFE
jgi:uncharacterized membrane protein